MPTGMSNVNGVLIPNFDNEPVEHIFPESAVPSAEDEEDRDGQMLDAMIMEYLKALNVASAAADKHKTELTIRTCQSDVATCSDKLGIR